MIKLIQIVEAECPKLYIAKRRVAHDKYVTHHYINLWKNSDLVSVAKDLPMRIQIIISNNDPLSTKEQAKETLDLFAKTKSVLGKYQPKCSKMIILENEACGHLSLLTNLKELKETIIKHLPKM